MVATDVAPNRIKIAQTQKQADFPPEDIQFVRADTYALQNVPGPFDAGLSVYWFSHVSKRRYDEFLDGFHQKIGGPGARVFMRDHPINDDPEAYTKPNDPDTYELRRLPNGSEYEIIKNALDKEELREIFAPKSTELTIRIGRDRSWWLWYTVA